MLKTEQFNSILGYHLLRITLRIPLQCSLKAFEYEDFFLLYIFAYCSYFDYEILIIITLYLKRFYYHTFSSQIALIQFYGVWTPRLPCPVMRTHVHATGTPSDAARKEHPQRDNRRQSRRRRSN